MTGIMDELDNHLLFSACQLFTPILILTPAFLKTLFVNTWKITLFPSPGLINSLYLKKGGKRVFNTKGFCYFRHFYQGWQNYLSIATGSAFLKNTVHCCKRWIRVVEENIAMEILTNAFISESRYHREFLACWEWLKCLLPSCRLHPNYVWILKVSPFLIYFSQAELYSSSSWSSCVYWFCFSVLFSKHIQWMPQLPV